MTWITTAICLLGTILNVKKKSLCFYLWTVANMMWAIYDFKTGLYSRMILDLVQLGFAVWGIIEWRKNG